MVFRDNRGQTFAGALIRQNLDISGGFLSSCYIIGYQTNEQIEQDYLKSGRDNPPNQAVELYADENYGII